MRETRAWIKGYVTALEDVIKDLEVQRHGYLNDPDAERLGDLIRAEIQESLTLALDTLSKLNEVKGAGDGQELPASAREAEAP